MSDKFQNPENPTDDELEEFKQLMEHPWVAPALAGLEPDIVPVSVRLEPLVAEMTGSDGQSESQNLGLLTIVDPTGIKTVYLSPSVVEQLVGLGMGMLQGWAEEPAPRLLVPTPEQASQAKMMHNQTNNLRSI